MGYSTIMELQEFFPYRLVVLADIVSRAISPVYAQRFGLSRDEWRVLAALAGRDSLKTSELIARTTLDKMQVSRALARLQEGGFVERQPDPDDARARIVNLTAAGRALFRRIVPMAEAREAFLLEALEPEEREVVLKALDKLRARAEVLERQG